MIKTIRTLAFGTALVLGTSGYLIDTTPSRALADDAAKALEIAQQALELAKSNAASNAGALSPEALTRILVENPQIIAIALEAAQQWEEEREMEMAARAITEQADLIYASAGSPVMGNPNGDATIVEFFDYQCGYCKRAANGMFAASKNDGNVRIVLKEFPILGPASVTASKAALAAKKQGKYDEMHMALINFKGRLSDKVVLKLAADQGLDVLTLQLDMDSPDVQREIDETRALAQSLGINGTPAFVVNDTLVPGAVPTDELMKLVAEQRG